MTTKIMSKTTARLLTVGAVLLLAGCVRDPYMMYGYYPPPAPVPLQPYVEPVVAPPVVHRRTVKHRHHRRARKPPCPCAQPVQ